MNKIFYILMFAVFSFYNAANAQTLKNIYQKNKPVLQIPTHLIDKVETVVESNVRKLKITQTSGYVILIPTANIDSITHSQGQAVDPAQLGNLRTGSAFGVVRNDQGDAVPMALVKSVYSPHQTTTDSNGVFFLNDFVVFNKLGFITVEKPGYFKGSRSFLPLENGANRVEIQLLPKTQSGSFPSTSGGQVSAGSLQLTFPANAIIQANGQPYSGNVNVFARALDPSAQEMFDQMPGDLLGGMNDSLRILRSFGMAAVELFGNNNEPLQLASGQNATMRFTIPADMLSDAPESIDWWSFDETIGYWKHEGTAQKTGDEYIGEASHFSWWNVDVPANFVDLNGVVNNIEDEPITGALVEVVTPNLGTGIRYTNTEGFFTGRVPINSNLIVNIKLTCNTTNDWALAYSENLQTGTVPINTQFTGSLDNRYPITGTVVNCEGQLVSSGYVKMGPQIFITRNGEFTIQTCAMGNYTFRAFDVDNHPTINTSSIISANVSQDGAEVGEVEVCDEVILIDVDNNIYQTVLIGTQRWMTENLKTTRFADGSVISNITDSNQWSQLTSGGWCYYENIETNGNIYGKLYNWFAVADPRNLCPNGWHVPSDEDWTVLIDFLGGESVAGGKMKSTGTQYWLVSNTAATNESGFSGLPGGGRGGGNGHFYSVGYNGNWWSSTVIGQNSSWYRFLDTNNGNATRNLINSRNGLSVRCVRD
jgi:uncharacterized protein (TIGR02145 family)